MRAFFEKLENGDKSQFFELLDQIDQKGIDLVQFAKQVIVYADQHLLENMDFYLKISQKLGDLLGVIRRYPHPRMAYKIVFNSFFDGEGDCVASVQSKTVSKGDKKSDIFLRSQNNQWKKIRLLLLIISRSSKLIKKNQQKYRFRRWIFPHFGKG